MPATHAATTVTQHNWASNVTYGTDRILVPETVEQVQRFVRDSPKVRTLGSRHSFNRIADSHDTIISLARLDRILSLNRDASTVTIEGGVRYAELGRYLHEEGFALHNLASLPHISVAGACATATHGSGEKNGNLAVAVSAMEFVSASGDIVQASRAHDGDAFSGMPVSLGALGVVTALTLDVIPTFDVCQDVYELLPFAQLDAHFDEIESSGYSVSLFTDWRDDRIGQVWRKRRADDGAALAAEPHFLGAARATEHRHPLPGISAVNCTAQMGVPGPWHERLPHFRMDFTPSSGEELQSEYFVPRTQAVAALHAVARVGAQINPLLLISEIRAIAADALWMSPCYHQDCIAIHFTWKPDWPAVRELLPLLESTLQPFDARPHWGKLFTMPPQRVRSCFPRLADFQELMRRHDPQGKFRNAFIDTYVS